MLHLIPKKSKLMHRGNKKTLKILSKSDIDTRNASKFIEFLNRNSCIHVYHMYVIDMVLESMMVFFFQAGLMCMYMCLWPVYSHRTYFRLTTEPLNESLFSQFNYVKY